jgi:hypothetical protein
MIDQVPTVPAKPKRIEAPPEPRRRPISKKVIRAIDLMIGGKAKNITEAADQVGIARETLSRNLSRPDIGETMRQKVVRSLAMAAGRASAVKVDLMESDNAIVRERASSFVLGMIGIAPQPNPASVSINLEIKAGYVIDLRDDDELPMKDVSPPQTR